MTSLAIGVVPGQAHFANVGQAVVLYQLNLWLKLLDVIDALLILLLLELLNVLTLLFAGSPFLGLP